ncbi:hypothetical protein C1H46_007561 [Malus baccata]|uniref:Uncharacterized protein n=1 Tax=Malus baccata TaxID=106549 RepID=A0A540N710_MALBA|nr:hypothetical protein C1H46_007561 [Malus baccata]
MSLVASITLALSKIALRQNTHSLKDNLIEIARLKLEDKQAEAEVSEEKRTNCIPPVFRDEQSEGG